MKRFANCCLGVVAATTLSVASAAHAQETPLEQSDPTAILGFPVEPQVTSSVTVGAEGATGATANTEAAAEGDVVFSVDLGGDDGPRVPSQSVVLIILITLLSVAPALLIMMTSFTRVVIVSPCCATLGLPPHHRTKFPLGSLVHFAIHHGANTFRSGTKASSHSPKAH